MPRPPKTVSGTAVTLPITRPQKNDAHDRLPISGTVLTRTYRGRRIEVKVLPDGTFEHEGAPYRSLSAVAKVVTGTHWNGHVFFGRTKVNRKEKAQ